MVRKIFCMIGLLVLGTVVFAAPARENPAIVPAHRHNDWTMRYLAINERVRQGNADLIFIGDSITHGWEGSGKEVWQKYYGSRNAVNVGISGDQTQSVLWRLEHGNIDGISPKVAVIMIGTNNSVAEEYTAQEIGDGIIAVCNKVREKLPKTKILLLAIFPRGQTLSAQRDKIAKASEIASKIADGKMIHYLDIGEKFIQQDKSISADIMPDYLHLSPKGYQIWAEAIEPKLVELMGEKKK
ncbi:MAG: platelet-activating factor acetylhydrolase IB subunit [Planctomycetota bacterium]|nr:platelet-activating factor acetylhydrolase IB subunit [Planctomycetota bacterium]